MPVFRNDGELYACIGGMMEKATTDRAMGEKVRDSRLIIRFSYSNPTATITIDAKNDPPEGTFFRVLYGDNDLVPDVSMEMEADVAHRFWLGKVNLTAALTRREIVARGPITKILRLLPVIKPAYTLYPEHLKQIGRSDLAG